MLGVSPAPTRSALPHLRASSRVRASAPSILSHTVNHCRSSARSQSSHIWTLPKLPRPPARPRESTGIANDGRVPRRALPRSSVDLKLEKQKKASRLACARIINVYSEGSVLRLNRGRHFDAASGASPDWCSSPRAVLTSPDVTRLGSGSRRKEAVKRQPVRKHETQVEQLTRREHHAVKITTSRVGIVQRRLPCTLAVVSSEASQRRKGDCQTGEPAREGGSEEAEETANGPVSDAEEIQLIHLTYLRKHSQYIEGILLQELLRMEHDEMIDGQ